MSKKTIVITGGAGGFGKEVATRIAAKGWRVIIGDLNTEKMEETKSDIVEKTGNGDIITLPLDLSSMRATREFASAIKALRLPINSFLGNAGVANASGRTKEDNLDMVFEINYLGHFLLTWLLLPELTKDGKILLISSDMHEGLFSPLKYKPAKEVAFPDESFANDPDRYNFSKLYILYFVYELADRLNAAGSKKVINAFNPGLMHTTGLIPDKRMFTEEFLNQMKATNHLGNLPQNADTVTALLTDDAIGRDNGVYYDRDNGPQKSSALSYEKEPRKELWDLSLQITGLKDDNLVL